MLLKIHILISIITLICYVLISKRCMEILPEEEKKLISRREKSTCNSILSIIRFVVVCSIPIFNIALLYVYLFKGDEVVKRTIKTLKNYE